jgi:hypothetical protein
MAGRLFQRKIPLHVSNMKSITYSGAGNATPLIGKSAFAAVSEILHFPPAD